MMMANINRSPKHSILLEQTKWLLHMCGCALKPLFIIGLFLTYIPVLHSCMQPTLWEWRCVHSTRYM